MNINYAGVCAVIAVSAVSMFIVLSVIALAWHGRQLTPHGAEALNVAIGGLLTLTGTYIGNRLGSSGHSE